MNEEKDIFKYDFIERSFFALVVGVIVFNLAVVIHGIWPQIIL